MVLILHSSPVILVLHSTHMILISHASPVILHLCRLILFLHSLVLYRSVKNLPSHSYHQSTKPLQTLPVQMGRYGKLLLSRIQENSMSCYFLL
ncbi:hypothetical protein PFLUV_G00277770 [Perca fluviatilis]|uniref:Uncharacterized protein n=1 Tax=Perca fluviatilis TaxID=8168 RepID=A0A6A5DT89_PERFL|nr:hypothetical protein PFLUV_G00277770 [Perca fluviatilis]